MAPEDQPPSDNSDEDPSQSPPLNATEPSETGATVDSKLDDHPSLSPREIYADTFPGGPAIRISDHDGDGIQGGDGIGVQERGRMSLSEYGGSVISVHDMGLPAVSNNTQRPPVKPGVIMSAQKLRNLFQLEDLDPKLESTVERAMSDKIQVSLKLSQADEEEYLPIDAFETIFNLNAITSLLHEKFRITNDELQQKLENILGMDETGSRRRILGILLCIGLLDTIDDFIKENICDRDFPLTRGPHRHSFKTKRDAVNINTTLLHSWRWPDIVSLYSFQRQLFVPFFKIEEGKLYSYVLDRSTILPWQARERKSRGGNAVVHQVQIHPSHHNFVQSQASDKKSVFALKEIEAEHELRDHQEAYRKELRALEKCHSMVQKEKHLIKLLLTFEHGDKYYFLFEWADGNLRELWERQTVIHSPSAERWAAQQCHGISTAIKRIHNVTSGEMENDVTPALSSNAEGDKRYGRHGDIKPQNILWFTNRGNDNGLLVVSDLGLTRYHSSLSKSAVSRVDGFTSAYHPPELAMKQRLGQGYDIWSLGCVYLEFCTWYLEGAEAVEAFELERYNDDISHIQGMEGDKYFNIVPDYTKGSDHKNGRPVVKEVVQKTSVKWIDRLSNLHSCTAFARQLLFLIKTQMLIVDPIQRAPIGQVCRELSNMKDSMQRSQVGKEIARARIFQERTDPDKNQVGSGQGQSQPLSEQDKAILVSHMEGGMNPAIDEDSFLINRNQRPRSTMGNVSAQGSPSRNSLELESQTATTPKPLSSTDDNRGSEGNPATVLAETRPTSTTNHVPTNREQGSTSSDDARAPALNKTSEQGHEHQPTEVPKMRIALGRVKQWVKECWKAITQAFKLL